MDAYIYIYHSLPLFLAHAHTYLTVTFAYDVGNRACVKVYGSPTNISL